jgi:uracil-DNA glycosylase
MIVSLDGPTDIQGFKCAARQLLTRAIGPEEIVWQVESGPPSLWPQDALIIGDEPVMPIAVPAWMAPLCDVALLHREPGRFHLLYTLLWRLVSEQDEVLRHDELDADRRAAEQLAREVRREVHKMRAFVRFFPHGEGEAQRHIAWFEPTHYVVEANGPFFVRRFAQMRWAIFTPGCSIEWDGKDLRVGPGVDRSGLPPVDPGASLWLTYYENIFNPARLKLAMMAKEMPRRYWKNLPEAALIAPLSAAAQARSDAMVDAGPTPARRIKPMRRPAD